MLKQTLLTVFAVGLLALSAPASATVGGTNVDIEYLNSTEDPQRNDFVFVRARATNNEAFSVRTRVYLNVAYPDGSDRTYSVLSADFPAGASVQVQKIKRIKFPIPADAPGGTYTVTLYAADDIANGGTIYDSDSFTFDLDPIVARGGTAPVVPDVDIEYLNSTEDPQRNDFVFVRARATNNEAFSVRTRVYLNVAYPDGSDRTYSVLSADFPAGASVQVQKIKRIKFPIPADAPEGTYDVTLYVADDIANGGTVYDADMFSFTLGPLAPCASGCADVTATSKTVSEAGPNPFSSATTIRYELATDADVDLRVFDVRGREVATLASGVQSAGVQSAVFAAGNLPGGVYVWRLAVDGEVTTGRVTLAR